MDNNTSMIENHVCLGYVSCIQVDGQPILPPLMNEARRQEMRHYRELAIQRQARRDREASQQKRPLTPLPSPPLINMETPKPKPRTRGVTFFEDTSPYVTVRQNRTQTRAPLFEEYDGTDKESNESRTPPGQSYESHFHILKDLTVSPGQVSNSSAEGGEVYDVVEADDEKSEYSTCSSKQDSVVTSPEEKNSVNIDEIKNINADSENNIESDSDGLDEHTVDGPCEIENHGDHGRKPAEPEPDGVSPIDMAGDSGDLISLTVSEPTNPDEEEDSYSQASFESDNSATSTGTFIIQSSQAHSAMNSSFLSEGEVVDVDEDDLDEAASLDIRNHNTQQNQINPVIRRCESADIVFKEENMSTVSNFTNTTSGGTSSFFDSFGSIGLSKLKIKMQTMSPSLFKIPGETRSPLLKGVIFMDPLNRPRAIKKIPAAALDPAMKPKFDRVTAAVKGYLVRRLLQTEKISNIIQTIHDTVELVLNLYDEAPNGQGRRGVKSEDINLHSRLIQQLTGACGSFHDVFFKLSITERMAIISTDRTKLRSKAMKASASKTIPPNKKTISVATLRCMERRKTFALHPSIPKRAKYQPVPDKLPLHVPSHFVHPPSVPPSVLSQAMKSKQHKKSYVVSPKRRRMTTLLKPTSTPASCRNPVSNRLSQLDKVKASSTSSLPSKRVPGPTAKIEHWNSKKLDTTYVKPKCTTRPLVSSNRC